LACPTKCFLLASGEFALGNDFTIWSGEWRDSYLPSSTVKRASA
jgi:hypothetical protein